LKCTLKRYAKGRIGTGSGLNDKHRFIGEGHIVCIAALHCYLGFRLGGLRKYREINCKMDSTI